MAAGVATEEQALALVAPSPVILTGGWKRQSVLADAQRNISHLARRATIDMKDVDGGSDVLHLLVRVKHARCVGVDHHIVLLRVSGESKQDVPGKLEIAVDREPDESGFDFV